MPHFQDTSFIIQSFHQTYHGRSGGILVYLKANIPSRLLTTYILPRNIKAIPFEINLRKRKWLFGSIYKPISTNDQYIFDSISKELQSVTKYIGSNNKQTQRFI